MKFKKHAIGFVFAASIALLAGSVIAQDGKGSSPGLLSSQSGSVSPQEANFSELPQGTPPIECLSFDGLESWDAQDDSDNIVIELDVGAGNTLTGVGWDIGIASVGASWLSEATILHSDSTGSADTNGITLAVGAAETAPGDMDFSSGGAIVDFSDNDLPDVVAGADGLLRLELFETFDDTADAIDANYRNAASPQLCAGLALACTDQTACNEAVTPGSGPPPPSVPIPVNNLWALAFLIALLAGLGVVAIRRFA